jgi:molybdopterin converting factor small subunit
MTVRVQMFALARQLAKGEVVELELQAQATLRDLRTALAAKAPELAPLMPHLMFSINAEYAGDEAVIPAGSEVACIPPVSGG